MDLFKKIVLLILLAQEKMLQRSLNKPLNKKSFKCAKAGCLLSLDAISESEKQKMEEELLLILKAAEFEPLEVLKYIESKGTSVFNIIDKCLLNYINEEVGFIYPQKGIKALYLSLITQKKIQFRTKEMFILEKKQIDKYYFIYHLYNWYAYTHNIEGLDIDSQDLLKKYLDNDTDISNLQPSDIYKLKNAIKQDKASIDFVIKLCQQYDGARNALEKIKKDGANL